MGKFLVFAESSGGILKKGTIELLTAVKNSGQACEILALGADAEVTANEAAKFGATGAIICNSPTLANYNPELFTVLVVDMIKKSQASTVLATSSSLGRDLFPRVGAKLNTGAISDCTELEISGENVVVRRPLYAAKCSAAVKFENGPIKIILMRPNQLPLGAPGVGSIKIESVALPKLDLKTVIKEVVRGTSQKLDLTEANIIVSGGRGLGEAKNFQLLESLANVLGATVGASRAVVDLGWVAHSMQVGQTGKTVAPSLYIAVGISGAIQHMAGMSSSKVIVAINKDAQAPIFQKATYGIVGDLFDILPKLTEEFKRVLS
ncbi:MAG: electron transfer flavoprotein subunit alpha/FixB family protein [Pseudomonadota bacterium]|nr:electron transfer flavoprotein subunit alpha/FixB family protein [Pseudomonadota bacterium]